MGTSRTIAVFVTALLVTVSAGVIASANISPLNAPSRNEGAGLNSVGAQKPISGTEYISGDDGVCLPHIPNAPRRRDKVAPK